MQIENRESEIGNHKDPFSRGVLEFSGIIAILGEYISGAISRPALESIEPSTDLNSIRRDLSLAGEAREYLRDSPRPGLASLRDPRPILEKLSVKGVSCSAFEILALLETAMAARDLRGLFAKTPRARLDELAGGMPDFQDLVAELDGKILPDGTVDSSASPELARIRRAIERLRHEVQSTLEKLVRRLGQEQVLQDALVTIRNDRFVIPVRSEEKRRVEGVVHGASSSGATVYLEPLETLPLNNELVELQDRELAEIQRILAEFSDKLRQRRQDLSAATALLSELDLAFAKAEFARAYACCLPEFVPNPRLELRDARHPLLEKTLRKEKRKPVPLTIELGEPESLMVISGPNTGGKTVALKTIGIAALMAQAGLPVPAAFARLPLFGRVLADIGDQQSIEANLSTFSAHVTNIQSMVAVANQNDLVLLDEIGASTDPHEGAALAVAILEHFRDRGAMSFVTTHQSRLKAYAADSPQAVNAAMEFDEATLQPTYRILVGLPGKSSGLEVAARLGLDPAIVERARALLDPAEAEAGALLATLHAEQSELEQKLAQLDRERAQIEVRRAQMTREFEVERRAKLKELDKRLEETLRQFDKKWETTIAEIRTQVEARIEAQSHAQGDAAAQARKSQSRRSGQSGPSSELGQSFGKLGRRIERTGDALEREAREEWDAQVLEVLGAPAEEQELLELSAGVEPAVGDTVRVPNIPSPGKLVSLAGRNQVEVEVGRLRMRLHKDKVRVLARSGASAVGRRSAATAATPPFRTVGAGPKPVATTQRVPPETPAEINVIGTTAEEAREQVDKFLDQAFLDGRLRLRVIHGHGKGVLKRTLHQMFASHPHVEKFYAAPANEGGTGATIVELKT